MQNQTKKSKNNFCHFYIVRHGETEWNRAGILQGQLDSPLTEAGIRQAITRSGTFKKIQFADAFSSDLFRAQKTAEVIVAERNIAVKTTRLLRERSFGAYDGKEIKIFLEELSDLLEAYEALTEDKQFSHRIRHDIESDDDIASRMLTFIRETAVAYPEKNVLVVAHGGIIRATLVKLGFASSRELPPQSIENLGYAVVDSDGVDFFVKKTQGINKKINFSS